MKDLEEIIIGCHQGPSKGKREAGGDVDRRGAPAGSEEGRGHKSRVAVVSRSWKGEKVLPYSLQKESSSVNDFSLVRTILGLSISGTVR